MSEVQVLTFSAHSSVAERSVHIGKAQGSIPCARINFMKFSNFKRIVFKIGYPIIILYWKIFKPKTFGARAIILNKNKILLVKNFLYNKYWLLPGGGINRKKMPEKGLMRELKEELNLSISKIDYKLGEYKSQGESKRDIIYIFVINLDSSHFSKQWELDDARWFDLSNLPENLSPATSRRIQEFLSRKRDIVSIW